MADKDPDYLPSLGRLLGFAERGCSALSERELAPYGLTVVDWVLLTAVWRKDGMTIGELAGYYRSNKTVLTRILDRMTECGLIEREADPGDRRVVRIRLTRKAENLSHLLSFHESINQSLLKGFSKQEQLAFFSSLERVISNIEEALGSESGPT